MQRVNRNGAKLRNEDDPIPRIIWSYWDTGWESAPEIVKLCRISWRKLNPEFEFRFLDSTNVGDWIHLSQIPHNFSALPAAHQADVIRLNLLSVYGGYWVDATLFCSRPLHQWIKRGPRTEFVIIDVPDSTDKLFDNFFIGSTSGGVFITSWLHGLVNCFNYSKGPMTKQFVKRVLRRVPILRLRWARAAFATSLALRRIGHPYFLAQYSGTKMLLKSPRLFMMWLKRDHHRCGKLSRYLASGASAASFSSELNQNPVGIWKLTHRVHKGQEGVFRDLERELSEFLRR